jgi:hypothetical protein
MPVHIEAMTSEVTVVEGELPFTPAQIETLVKLVLRRLAAKQHEAKQTREATALRREAMPPTPIGE